MRRHRSVVQPFTFASSHRMWHWGTDTPTATSTLLPFKTLTQKVHNIKHNGCIFAPYSFGAAAAVLQNVCKYVTYKQWLSPLACAHLGVCGRIATSKCAATVRTKFHCKTRQQQQTVLNLATTHWNALFCSTDQSDVDGAVVRVPQDSQSTANTETMPTSHQHGACESNSELHRCESQGRHRSLG